MGRIPSVLGLFPYYAQEESKEICRTFQLDAYQMLPVQPQQL